MVTTGDGRHFDEAAPGVSDRSREWASTMAGYRSRLEGVTQPHDGRPVEVGAFELLEREAREQAEDAALAPGATRAVGAGRRARPEAPDPWRTCFERDRDRVLHQERSFRRLAGKTQVFIFPADHQRTRLTHALEVAQVATAIARVCRLNVALAETIALAHDCGHGPFGHASEDALDPYVPGGFRHAPWGADVTLARLNLCAETLDGVRNHSWSRPTPATPEALVVRLADRIAYVCHDFEDAESAGIASSASLPGVVRERCGTGRDSQLGAFITDVATTTARTGFVAMSSDLAEALAAFRRWNYEHIYLRPDSLAQAGEVRDLLQALVERYLAQPWLVPGGAGPDAEHPERLAVSYVAGMTDRFACEQAVRILGWDAARLPRGFDVSAGAA